MKVNILIPYAVPFTVMFKKDSKVRGTFIRCEDIGFKKLTRGKDFMLQASPMEWGSSNTCGLSPLEDVITIATSLAPGKDLHNQQMAINSWLKLGFKVISMNSSEEIAALQSYFPDIEFVKAHRDGRDKFTKPYIYFDDCLAYFAKSESTICGIVNSDIYLLKEEFYSFLKKEAIHSFVYGSRVDVEIIGKLNGTLFELGFDYFFFNKQIIPHYPQSNFLIGLPMWDFWAVLIPICFRIPVKKVITPHAYHIIHKTNWDHKIWCVFRDELLRYIKPTANLPINTYSMYLLGVIAKYSIEISLWDDDIYK